MNHFRIGYGRTSTVLPLTTFDECAHLFEQAPPLGLGIEFALDLPRALAHEDNDAFILTCIQPEAVLIFGAIIQFQIIEPILELLQTPCTLWT